VDKINTFIPLPLFVYGTLKKGFPNHELFLKNAQPIGSAWVKGTLLDLKYYPGFISEGEGQVWGELYNITKSMLASIDHLEGVGFLYDRIIVEAHQWGDKQHRAWTYEYKERENVISRIIPNGLWERGNVQDKSPSLQMV
jgi:gamma-glutamylaminecyclotransferase